MGKQIINILFEGLVVFNFEQKFFCVINDKICFIVIFLMFFNVIVFVEIEIIWIDIDMLKEEIIKIFSCEVNKIVKQIWDQYVDFDIVGF